MKICMIGDGNSIFVMRISDYMRAHGHAVQMIMIGSAPMESEPLKHYDGCSTVVRRPGLGGYVGKVLPVRRLVKKMQPDIVHGHYLTSGGFYARWSGGKTIVNTVWGSDIYQDAKQFQKRLLVSSAIKGSDAVTGDSDHIISTVRSYCPTVRTLKVLMGVDTNIFVPMPELKPKVFTFLSGRSSYPIYNPIRIVKAFELLEGTDSRLLVQKSKDSYPELEKIVERSPVKDRIEWYPVRPHAQMPALFGKAHVTVSIPNSDSSSGVMMESMSCGVSVIASPIPQNEEWDGLGIYVPKDDSVEALADLMRKVMEQPEILKAYGKFAREIIIQRADWNKQMEGLVRLYEELLG